MTSQHALHLFWCCTRSLLFRAFSVVAFHPATRLEVQDAQAMPKKHIYNHCPGVLLAGLLPKPEDFSMRH